MAKKVNIKKITPTKPVKQKLFKRPNINLLVSMTVLILSLFFVLYQANQPQNVTSRAAGDCGVTTAQLQITSQEQSLFDQINAYRAQQGRDPLAWDPGLNRAAAWLSKDMITRGNVNHIDSLGRTVPIRFSDCGVAQTNNYGETIINGAHQADEIIAGWKMDPPDNAILLNSTYASGAVAVEVDGTGESAYWTFTATGPPLAGLTPTFGPGPSGIPIVTEYVPSPVCLGACPTSQPSVTRPVVTPTGGPTPTNPTFPTITDVPGGDGPGNGGTPGISGTIGPTQDPNNPNPGGGGNISITPDPNNPDPDNPGGDGGGLPPLDGEGGFLGFLLALLLLFFKFLLSLVGR